FTLMEVLLVLVILVILGSLVVGLYTNVQRKAKMDAAKSQISAFEGPLDLYQLNMGDYPSTAQGLQALRQAPGDARSSNQWAGPYLSKDIPLDPWGNPYQYSAPGARNPDRFDIFSFGPDGASGTADDVGNW